jgi:DNA-directed RNA polymerase subunit RPC12/RpoP
MSNQEHPRVALNPIPTPWTQHIISAPPILIASTNTVDYICGDCGAVLMHAEEGQVHNLIIHCTECGSYNSTDKSPAQLVGSSL